jgi:hypothetical protein
MAIYRQHLEQHFELKKVSGWVALHPKTGFDLTGFRTTRVAKVSKSSEFQFTIGATKLGETRQLNETIRTIIRGEGIAVVERQTTSGTSKPKKEYPGFSLRKLTASNFDSIVLQVFDAVKQVQSDNST